MLSKTFTFYWFYFYKSLDLKPTATIQKWDINWTNVHYVEIKSGIRWEECSVYS